MNRKTILIVDDNMVIRKGLMSLLENEPDIGIVGEASNGAEAVAMVGKASIDVVLMDIRMPGMDGIKAVSTIVRIRPETSVLAITAVEDPFILAQSLIAGAKGCLVYSHFVPVKLMEAIRDVVSGKEVPISSSVAREVLNLTKTAKQRQPRPSKGPRLASVTTREEDVLKLMAEGCTNIEIADALCIAEKTVKNHINSIYSKLRVKNRYEIISQRPRRTS